MKNHKIQWLNPENMKGETWNPVIGCSKKSDGCKNCYAEIMARRLAYMEQKNYQKVLKCENVAGGGEFEDPDQWEFDGWNGNTVFAEEAIYKTLKWKKPRMIFVCSMGDLFHDTVKEEWIDKVMTIIAASPKHIFLVLTKRPDRMAEYFSAGKDVLSERWSNQCYELGISDDSEDPDSGACYISNRCNGHTKKETTGWPLTNLWLGTSTENQEQSDKRIPYLLKCPAIVKYVSIEPMLGAIDLVSKESLRFSNKPFLKYLDWVIVGGESGHKARPMHPDWVRSIRDQCKKAKTPFFFKQWGELLPGCQVNNVKQVGRNSKQFQSPHNPDKMNTYYKVGKHKSGNLIDGENLLEYPI